VDRPARFEAATAAPAAKSAAIPHVDVKQAPFREQAKFVAEEHGKAVAKLASEAGMDPGKYQSEVARKIQEAVDHGDHYIRADSRIVEGILRDGRFKTQFETNTSAGDLDHRARTEVEAKLFGTRPDVAPEHRPVYGFVASRDFATAAHDSQVRVSGYGDAVFKLKPHVRDRATLTLGDSLARSDQLRSAPATAVTSDLAPLGGYSWARTHKEFLSHAGSPSERLEHLAANHGYVEAQYHGGITHRDVAEVAFPSEPSREIRAALKRRGIPYRVTPTEQPIGPGFHLGVE
jgi:hypothetical protein